MINNTEQDIIETAHAMADAARVVILPYFRGKSLNTENKLTDGFDPVTVADRAAERAMRDVLGQRRPDDTIIGEEYGLSEGNSGYTWVLDPIDGTRGFISGTPTWGVLIALSDATGPVFGIIDQPYIRERFVGGYGQAYLDGPSGQMDLRVARTKTLKNATILTTFPEVGTESEGRAFHAVAKQCKLTRYGMDCYGYALLAAGQVDLVIEAGLSNYDIQAPIAVIRASGGIVTDWRGGPAYDGGRVLAAATPELHATAMDILKHHTDD